MAQQVASYLANGHDGCKGEMNKGKRERGGRRVRVLKVPKSAEKNIFVVVLLAVAPSGLRTGWGSGGSPCF